jgi:hypothetical protein
MCYQILFADMPSSLSRFSCFIRQNGQVPFNSIIVPEVRRKLAPEPKAVEIFEFFINDVNLLLGCNSNVKKAV